MGLIRDLRNIENSAAAMATGSTADDTKMLIVLQLMQMGWPGLDQRGAAEWINDWVKKHGLGGR